MTFFIYLFFVLSNIALRCYASSEEDRLDNLARRRQESKRLADYFGHNIKSRRYEFHFNPHDTGPIIGAPSLPSHLPEAEPILPGHTLIRPALGMLKSSIKFPQTELENGAGVLGNYNNLGIKYDGRNERVAYSDFRRSAPDSGFRRYRSYPFENSRRTLADYIMVVPSAQKSKAKPSFSLTNLVLDIDNEKRARNIIQDRLKLIQPQKYKQNRDKSQPDEWVECSLLARVLPPQAALTSQYRSQHYPTNAPLHLTDLFKDDDSTEWNSRRHKTKEPNKFSGEANEDDTEVSNEETEAEKLPVLPQEEEKEKPLTKIQKFLQAQKQFNFVKINQDALDLQELVPINEDSSLTKKRQWWFYNEADFETFEKD